MAGLELLGRIAAGGAVLSFGGALAFYNFVKSNVTNSSYVKEGIALAKSSQAAHDALGGELNVQDIKLLGEKRTRLRADAAQVCSPSHRAIKVN